MKPHKSIQVFQNPILEKFTHVHPITPLVLWLPVIAILIYRSVVVHDFGMAGLASMALIGLFVWTLTEYLLHRFAFHFEPTTPFQERVLFLIHGLHHDDPIDPTRLVMPPLPGIVMAAILFGVFRIILGQTYVEPFFAFFMVGYLCYDYTHFAVHHFTPRTRFGKLNKHHHMQHHYVNQGTRFGVSSPLWDVIFGTLKESKKEQAI